jgi:hypothetical protein
LISPAVSKSFFYRHLIPRQRLYMQIMRAIGII